MKNGNIWISNDSGATWTEDTSIGATKNWFNITSSSDGTKLVACVGGGNVWVSNDSGATWTEDIINISGNKYWQKVTSSADGTKLAMVEYQGHIWTKIEGIPGPTITDVQNLTVKYTKNLDHTNKNLIGTSPSSVAVDSFNFVGTNRIQHNR